MTVAMVLLVGGDPETVKVARTAVEAAGHTFAAVDSTDEADIALETIVAGAVLLDVGPRAVGWLDRKAVDDPRFARRTVLILSPAARAAAREDASRLGCRTLAKPVGEEQLRESLRSILPPD